MRLFRRHHLVVVSILIFALLSRTVSSHVRSNLIDDSIKRSRSNFRTVTRHLQDGNDEENRDGQYDNNNEYYDDDTWQGKANQAKDRVEQDFTNMWSTSPSEWTDEYWEVLVIAYALMLLLICMFCSTCCGPSDNNNARNIQVATTGDKIQKSNTKNDGKRQQILNKERTRQVPAPQPMPSYVSSADSAVDPAEEKPRKRKLTLWGEVMNVWSETFDELFRNGKNRNRNNTSLYFDDYHHMEEDFTGKEDIPNEIGDNKARSKGIPPAVETRTKKKRKASVRKNNKRQSKNNLASLQERIAALQSKSWTQKQSVDEQSTAYEPSPEAAISTTFTTEVEDSDEEGKVKRNAQQKKSRSMYED